MAVNNIKNVIFISLCIMLLFTDVNWATEDSVVYQSFTAHLSKQIPIYRELLRLGRGSVTCISWRPDGQALAVGGSLGVWIYTDTLDDIAYLGERGDIGSITWSSDNNRLAALSWDSAIVRVWDTFTKQTIVAFQTYAALDLAWSPNGDYIATAESDSTVKLWDATTCKLIMKLDDPIFENFKTYSRSSVIWSPDGSKVAVVLGNHPLPGFETESLVQLWDVASGQPLITFQPHTAVIRSLAWSPDGKMLASADGDQVVRIWEVTTGNLSTELADNGGDLVTAVNWSPDGSMLAMAKLDGEVAIWSASPWKIKTSFHESAEISYIDWQPNREKLASVSVRDEIKIWNVDQGQIVSSYNGHMGDLKSIAWGPSENQIIVTNSTGVVRIWDLVSGEFQDVFQEYSGFDRLFWSPDMMKLAANQEKQGRLLILDVATNSLLSIIQANHLLWAAWTWDKSKIATAHNDGTIHIWEASTGRLLISFLAYSADTPLSSRQSAWSPDNQYLATWNVQTSETGISTSSPVLIWDTNTGQTITILEEPPTKDISVVWSVYGSNLAVRGYSDTIQIWEAPTERLLIQLVDPNGGPVSTIAWRPDRNMLASGVSSPNELQIWDLITGDLVFTSRRYRQPISLLFWSSDGQRLIGSVGQEILVWDAETWEELAIVEGVVSSALNSDGSQFISAHYDGTVRVWGS